MDSYFAVTAPGVEEFTALELARLGLLPASDAAPQPVTVNAQPQLTFTGGLPALYRANLHLRSASRILARLGQWFYARDFTELRERAARLPWERFLSPGQPVSLRVTCHKSKLYHSDAVAERVVAAIADRLGKESPVQKAADEDFSAQRIVVLLDDDRATLSVDSSGDLLHRRGYRLATAKAPLRETLAATLLLASGWDAESPLVDPFCGSGTIPIEAALLALGLPPGRNRRFAFMDWPDFDAALWQSLCAEADAARSAAPPPFIFGADRDAGAIEMAQANAARAGVEQFIQFRCQAVSNLHRAPLDTLAPGWVVTNPPYGLRVSEGKDLRNLYAQFGNVLRAGFPGWQVGALSSDLALLGQMKIKMDTSLRLVNGGVNVTFGRGQVRGS
ncbi:MAG: hypothetical protein CO094_11155 [Anaerolineae bacterium CG_4_9_14_3_um_filter_57_17]|nr:class I SAM-dependent RNA methyltransferase [bacterium]NCT21984.1 class I SAM-dependent RNA methyltransferase [bacterium]OIO86681.1 MAG: hypothetical protein AUK01_02385 [Anaerolineae bacterium CG2_30_57_67]PJB64965.1 MAG: hypothetical protein CO094_11155 [Anaerolineae bacterium CG_4_9_14_3_um_filter_57_17]